GPKLLIWAHLRRQIASGVSIDAWARPSRWRFAGPYVEAQAGDGGFTAGVGWGEGAAVTPARQRRAASLRARTRHGARCRRPVRHPAATGHGLASADRRRHRAAGGNRQR